MIDCTAPLKRIRKEESGTVMMTTLFFLICLCGLISLLLLVEQAGVIQMKSQQTADLVTKGARAAGKWAYVDSGVLQKKLFATTREAERNKANIIRGAREEAEILWELNRPAIDKIAEEIIVIHQKGEQKSLYNQGIYHLRLTIKSSIQLLWERIYLSLERVSQSGLR